MWFRLGVAEKGSVTLELTVTQFASHSSFPPWETSIGILSEAVSKVEKNKLPSMLGTGPERYTLEYVAPYVSCRIWFCTVLVCLFNFPSLNF
jgi:carboxypeptidase PM20D1